MPQDFGPAQPIANVFQKGYDFVEKYLGDPSKPASGSSAAIKPDSSYQREMLKRANESFRKAADEDNARKASASSSKTGASRTAPARKSLSGARKVISTKR